MLTTYYARSDVVRGLDMESILRPITKEIITAMRPRIQYDIVRKTLYPDLDGTIYPPPQEVDLVPLQRTNPAVSKDEPVVQLE